MREKRIIYRSSPIYGCGVDKFLKAGLCAQYGTQCQYCGAKWSNREFDALEIDHIIPISIVPGTVSEELTRQWDIAPEWALSFSELLVPPNLDSVLNLTLACPFHNITKANVLLHPAALQLLLIRAQAVCDDVLRMVASLAQWEYCPELPYLRTEPPSKSDDETMGDEFVR